jgi:GT2 family glycosyltransferase
LTQPLDHGKWEIIVVDNGSREPKTLRYLEEIKGQDNVTILRDDGPFNYSRLNNRAVEQSQGDVLVFLNNDTEVISSHWLQRLVAQAERPDVGAVGACLLFEDGSVQHGGVLLGIGGVAGHAHKYRNGADDGECLTLRLRREFAAVTGAVLAVERRKFDAVGGLDETHLGVNYNDVDICLRLTLQGWRTLCCPDVRLYHHESRSRGAPVGAAYIQWQQERATMLSRWKPWIEDDPWYNPHFSRREENFGLRLVPALIGLRCWRTPRPSSPVLQP